MHAPGRLRTFVLTLLLAGAAVAQGIAIPVTTLADSGPGSFRAAIEEANRVAGLASPTNRIVITFDASLGGGTLPAQGGFPVLFASHVTIQVGGAVPVPVLLDMPESFIASSRELLLRDLRFRRPGNNAGSGDNAILVACTNLRIERCAFENPPIAGLFLVSCRDAVIQDCTFLNNHPTRAGQGMLCQDASDRLRLERCTFDGLRNRGMSLVAVEGSRVRDCTFRNCGGAILLTERCVDTEIGPGCLVENATQVAIAADLTGPADPRNPASVGLRIRQNTFRDGINIAILLRNRCRATVIEGNVLERNGGNGQAQIMTLDAEGVILRDNRITGGGGGGIGIVRGRDFDLPSGNVIENNMGDGIAATDAAQVWVGPRAPGAGAGAGNVLRGNRNASLRFTGIAGGGLTGNPGAPGGRATIQGNTGPVVITNGCSQCVIGPGVDVTGGAPSAVELIGAAGLRVRDVVASGYADRGLYVSACVDVEVRDCAFQGPRPAAYGVTMFDTTPVRLFDIDCRSHAFAGFAFLGCADVLAGPGCRAVDCGLFGFTLQPGAASAPRATLQSCIALNHAGAGAGIAFQDMNGSVVNCTAAGNLRGLQVNGTASVTAVNCVLWANRERDRISGPTSLATLEHSVFGSSQGPWLGGTGNQTVDPLLANLPGGDARLLPGSPAIDAGSVFVDRLPVADADLLQRVRGPRVDCGAFERAQPTALTVAGPVFHDRGNPVFVLSLDAGAANGNGERLLLVSFSGTNPGLPLFGGAVMPLRPDSITTGFFLSPYAVGRLDGLGRETFVLPVPPEIMPFLPSELTFAYTLWPAATWSSNPALLRLF